MLAAANRIWTAICLIDSWPHKPCGCDYATLDLKNFRFLSLNCCQNGRIARHNVPMRILPLH